MVDPYRLVGVTLAGKYRLDEFAGSGGMGIVYKSLHNKFNIPVAVKILKPDVVFKNPQTAQLFQQEVEAVKSLDHPHIVRVFDSGIDDNNLSFMVMEWLSGQTLEDLINQGQLPVERVVHIFRQVCSAFAYAHSKRVIHLDIKPTNIFLMNAPSDDIKIIDFGLARVLKSDSGTYVTRFFGTIHYCSPEHFGGKVSSRSDIYSLGVTLYQSLAGVIPFGGSYIHAKIYQNLDLPPIPSITNMCKDIRGDIDQVLNKALCKNPDDRYQSVEEFFNDFLEASGVAEISEEENINLPTEKKLSTIDAKQSISDPHSFFSLKGLILWWDSIDYKLNLIPIGIAIITLLIAILVLISKIE